MNARVKLYNARLSFANGLFKAQSINGGEAKFSADFLIDENTKVYKIVEGKPVEMSMDDIMLEVANVTWKGNGKKMLSTLEASKKCYRDGDLKVTKSGEPYEIYAGLHYITAKRKSRPELKNRDGSTITEQDGVIYSGCRVHVSFDVYGNSKAETKGVFAGLRTVQFYKDGAAFGGEGDAEDSFDDISVPEDTTEEFC